MGFMRAMACMGGWLEGRHAFMGVVPSAFFPQHMTNADMHVQTTVDFRVS